MWYQPWAIKPLWGFAVSHGLQYVGSLGFWINSNWQGTCPSLKRLNVSAWWCMYFTFLKRNWDKQTKKNSWGRIKRKNFDSLSLHQYIRHSAWGQQTALLLMVYLLHSSKQPNRSPIYMLFVSTAVQWDWLIRDFTSCFDNVTDGIHSFSILSILRTISSKVLLYASLFTLLICGNRKERGQRSIDILVQSYCPLTYYCNIKIILLNTHKFHIQEAISLKGWFFTPVTSRELTGLWSLVFRVIWLW